MKPGLFFKHLPHHLSRSYLVILSFNIFKTPSLPNRKSCSLFMPIPGYSSLLKPRTNDKSKFFLRSFFLMWFSTLECHVSFYFHRNPSSSNFLLCLLKTQLERHLLTRHWLPFSRFLETLSCQNLDCKFAPCVYPKSKTVLKMSNWFNGYGNVKWKFSKQKDSSRELSYTGRVCYQPGYSV